MGGLPGWKILLPLTMVITVVVTSELENQKWGDPKDCSIYYVVQKRTCESGLRFNCTTQKCDKQAKVDCTCNGKWTSRENGYDDDSSSNESSPGKKEHCVSHTGSSSSEVKVSEGYSKCDKGSGSPEHDNGSGHRGYGVGDEGSGSEGHGKWNGNDGSKSSGGHSTGGFHWDNSSQEDGSQEHHSDSQHEGNDTQHREEHGSSEGNSKGQGIQKVESILQMLKNSYVMSIFRKGSIVIMMDITINNVFYKLQLKVLSFFIEILNRVHSSIAIITCSETANLLIKPGHYDISALISILEGIKQHGNSVNYTAAIEEYKQVHQNADANILWLIGSENSTKVTSEITQMQRRVDILCVAVGIHRHTEWTKMCSRDKNGTPLCYQVQDANLIEIAYKYLSMMQNLGRHSFGISESRDESGKSHGIFWS
ncbi:uncharacterized protein [Anabrus simplex]|uniref:uncharacterized protein n=1 Tax=Anabrus simplex TaxID=316456 RepID=UPI0035A385E3